ncbi:DNA repair protein RecO [Carnobacterium divergens]|uniref:DNA repair protein RecO n=1 Tax=Carnobacterium divergens TaxID=2748 RepID=UPI001072355F|nr:DNA repair protein RecO [Carnobacterium divergens]MDT1995112.1 DNA repair protein RecO [Carnobacterium divergens]TFI64153.1 DNA repair protein RecO [Carnobacterium divergens]TFI67469.1 DNA repair protein RecO [Carnobacterium divergens]TFI79561.1 DNA repair protein RecO [Carnobacterium divergens]TFI79930.1 DNA repair protein RecO [Carnobacterium divergens]
MGPLEEIEGIVLSVRNHRENDQLVKIFTNRFGKRMFFVKGTRKANSKIKSAVLPFTKASYIADIRDSGLCFLRDAKEVTHFNAMQTDIFLNAYATYVLNLADAALEDGVVDPVLFNKVEMTLTDIDEGYDPEIMVNIFEVQLLPYFGVAPELRGCKVCGEMDGNFDYSDSYGGLLCQKHWSLDEHRYHASPRAIYFLQIFSRISLDKLGTITVKEETKKELRHLIDMIYDESVGIKLKSKSFIDQMYTWGDMLLKKDKNSVN